MIASHPRLPAFISNGLRPWFSYRLTRLPACISCPRAFARSKPIHPDLAPGNKSKGSCARFCLERILPVVAPLPSGYGRSIGNQKYLRPHCLNPTARTAKCHDRRFWAFTGLNLLGRTISAFSHLFLTWLPRNVFKEKRLCHKVVYS